MAESKNGSKTSKVTTSGQLEDQKFHQHLEMPAKYFEDTVRLQMCLLLDENVLKDIELTFRLNSFTFQFLGSESNLSRCRSRASSAKMSSFVLSLLSPVLRTTVCGNFQEGICKRISLDDVEESRFSHLVKLACGEDGLVAESIEELVEMGKLAEFLQMEAVRDYVEDTVLKQVKECNSVELLATIDASGLWRLREACCKIVRDNFETVSQREAFRKLSEETIGDLLDEDDLRAFQEETVFEAVVHWMKGSGNELRGERLLKKIRYGAMDNEYLAARIRSALSGHRTLQMLVGEALVKRRGKEENAIWDGVERLCDRWMVPRKIKAPAPLLNLPAGATLGEDVLKDPRYVAIDHEGHILVTDIELHQVVVFNCDGSVLRRLGSEGKAPGQFKWPLGIAVDRRGRIVVADCFNHRIQTLNADGSVVSCFGSRGSAVGQLNEPYGVAIDMQGHIIVADSENHRIQVFSPNGSVVRHFGSKGGKGSQLYWPIDVAVDAAGRIAVAEWKLWNPRVQVFNVDNSVALLFNAKSCGVSVDMEDRFIIADENRVIQLNVDENKVRIVNAGRGVFSLKNPIGLAVDGAGRVLVVEGRSSSSDSKNNKVIVV